MAKEKRMFAGSLKRFLFVEKKRKQVKFESQGSSLAVISEETEGVGVDNVYIESGETKKSKKKSKSRNHEDV